MDYKPQCSNNSSVINICHRSTHAEEMAIEKLPIKRKQSKKKFINVSMLVIRISHASNCETFKLSNSKPCISCLFKIQNCFLNGYKINKLYYSNENGEITYSKVKDLIKCNHTVSKFYRKSNIPKWLN